MLISRSQKVFAVSTDAAARHGAANAHAIVSGVQGGVVKTLATVSDGHRNALKGPEDTRGQNRMVSTIRTSPVVE